MSQKELGSIFGFLVLLTFSIAVGPAQAATNSKATFQVTADVEATCQISATNLDFGDYTGTQAASTSTITVICTNNQGYDIGLDAGTSGGGVTVRKMTGPGGAILGYGLYRDANHTTNWGNTVSTDTVHGNGSGGAQTLTVYGLMPSAEYVMSGVYTDTVTATATY